MKLRKWTCVHDAQVLLCELRSLVYCLAKMCISAYDLLLTSVEVENKSVIHSYSFCSPCHRFCTHMKMKVNVNRHGMGSLFVCLFV